MAYCMPKTLYHVLTHWFLIHWFSTLLITLFTNAFMECTVCLYSNFYLLSSFIKLLLVFCVSVTFNHLKTAQTYEEPNSWTCCHLNTVTPYCMQSFTSFSFVFTWTKKYNKRFMLHMVCNGTGLRKNVGCYCNNWLYLVPIK